MTEERGPATGARTRRGELRAAVPLFRHEVLDARREKALGDVLLVTPRSP